MGESLSLIQKAVNKKFGDGVGIELNIRLFPPGGEFSVKVEEYGFYDGIAKVDRTTYLNGGGVGELLSTIKNYEIAK